MNKVGEVDKSTKKSMKYLCNDCLNWIVNFMMSGAMLDPYTLVFQGLALCLAYSRFSINSC